MKRDQKVQGLKLNLVNISAGKDGSDGQNTPKTTNREREGADETNMIEMNRQTSEKLLDFKLVQN